MVPSENKHLFCQQSLAHAVLGLLDSNARLPRNSGRTSCKDRIDPPLMRVVRIYGGFWLCLLKTPSVDSARSRSFFVHHGRYPKEHEAHFPNELFCQICHSKAFAPYLSGTCSLPRI